MQNYISQIINLALEYTNKKDPCKINGQRDNGLKISSYYAGCKKDSVYDQDKQSQSVTAKFLYCFHVFILFT